jgi:segregation and condensation protein B
MSPLEDAANASATRSGAASDAEPVWDCTEIERLYQQALDAVEAVAGDLTSVSATLSDESEEELAPESEASIEVTEAAPPSVPEAETRPDPVQVIEAILFVGGEPLTAKAIGELLHGDLEVGFVERAIEDLRNRYARQGRPYEIRLNENGYRITLCSDFEPVRNRVYGFGPKQVRLSQETLEILALVAYRQPITRKRTEELAGRNAGSALRQLAERGLLILDPPHEGAKEPQYRTSPRFLQLFGISQLDDLPQIEDLNYK